MLNNTELLAVQLLLPQSFIVGILPEDSVIILQGINALIFQQQLHQQNYFSIKFKE